MTWNTLISLAKNYTRAPGHQLHHLYLRAYLTYSQHQYLHVLTEYCCLWRVTYSDESAQAILYHFPRPQAYLHPTTPTLLTAGVNAFTIKQLLTLIWCENHHHVTRRICFPVVTNKWHVQTCKCTKRCLRLTYLLCFISMVCMYLQRQSFVWNYYGLFYKYTVLKVYSEPFKIKIRCRVGWVGDKSTCCPERFISLSTFVTMCVTHQS